MILSPKQAKVVNFIHTPDRILSLTGSVGSGKSVPSNLAVAYFITRHLKGRGFALVGNSSISMLENQVDDGVEYGIMWQLRRLGFNPVIKRGGATTLYVPTIHGTQAIPIVGAGDAKSLGRIQGKGLAGAYLDEATLIPEIVLAMLLSRFRKENTKVWATMNPGDSQHHYKKMVIDNDKVKGKTLHFTARDNPVMTPELEDAMIGHLIPGSPMHDRYALGKWTALSGVIYDQWAYGEEIPKEDQKEWEVCMDWGIGGICMTSLFCKGPDYDLLRYDYSYDSRVEIPLTPADHAIRIKDWVKSNGLTPEGMKCIIDPSTSNLMKPELGRCGFRVVNAKNDVDRGILQTIKVLANRKLRIHSDCKDTILDMRRYIWDPKQRNKPLKTDDISHAADVLRYYAYTNYKNPRLAAGSLRR